MHAPTRHNNFDLLRLALALLVVLSHSAELIDGNRSREPLTQLFGTLSFGDLAVDGFFILSGYLISASWLAQPHWRSYAAKRVLRIVPGFAVASLISAWLVGPLAVASAASYVSQFPWPQYLWSLINLDAPATPAVFDGFAHANVNGALWSIHYEAACYLMVAALGAAGLLKRPVALGLLIAAGLAMLVVPHLLLGHVPASVQNKLGNPFIRLAPFYLMGIGLYVFRQHVPVSRWWAVASLVVMATTLPFEGSANIGLAVGLSYLLYYLGHAQWPALNGLRRMPDVSYGVYLYAWPIQKLLLWWQVVETPWALFALSALLSLVMGTVSWHVVERPALQLKKRLRRA
jgi:peptidoglycan/LPS O-acetylase OafA/YrhL